MTAVNWRVSPESPGVHTLDVIVPPVGVPAVIVMPVTEITLAVNVGVIVALPERTTVVEALVELAKVALAAGLADHEEKT